MRRLNGWVILFTILTMLIGIKLSFAESGESERFSREGAEEDRLDYLVRHGDDIWLYSTSLGEVNLKRIRGEIYDARKLVEFVREHDLRRGVPLIYILAAACFWVLDRKSVV